MRRIHWSALAADARAEALARPVRRDDARLRRGVRRIFAEVEAGGAPALRALTRRFDGVDVAEARVPEAAFAAAEASLPAAVRAALDAAIERLTHWHRGGQGQEFSLETAAGVRCGRLLRPIPRVGLYVPAGSAPLPSTALMLGVPARLAGCRDVVLCTPPRADGGADPAVLAAAARCGIRDVYRIGGAQAIAAMALGAGGVPRCDKLFGPGNAWVDAAKRHAAALPGGPAIDLPAGPSEVLVIADAGARPAWIAADLLAQAEHGPDAQAIVLSDSPALLDAVAAELPRQLARLPRAAIAAQALQAARLVQVASLDEAFALAAEYAPEHLLLALREPRQWLPRVQCAGSVFLGDHTPETLGDYNSGTNHVLPTGGAARAWSGVGVGAFQLAISVQEVTPAGLAAIGPEAVTLARAEGLEAHAQAVLQRLPAVAA
ncbi:histidinol dehydrogenase [Arenimonas composti]|uniref:Histidinol dehydrogenase n=1 Tax=Arenimonas composti TR7-09 = DSM 18010 TaxID=1121013 RepID=A0A091BB43_9GAMM|nr:histidinol dehydrogenase [Arenimonas composti]KFN48926.1 hypothetical protein P873_01100 [Arenimonas composti TR7-09 = DSM 18010]